MIMVSISWLALKRLNQNLVDEVKTLLDVKLHEVIMRSMITQLDEKQSLGISTSAIFEEAPAREVGSFLKENRMDI